MAQTGRYLPEGDYHAGASRGGGPFAGPQVTNTRRPVGTSQFVPRPSGAGEHIDRHPFAYVGTENSGRESGLKDPQLDGPARASFRLLRLQWYRWIGTDATRNYDPPRDYKPYGHQDGTDTMIWGGQPGFYVPYGQRGASLTDVARNTGGGARVVLLGGPPHGLHTHSPQPRATTRQVYDDTGQMVAGRQSRISNSRRNGQSYSQTTVPQGGAAR